MVRLVRGAAVLAVLLVATPVAAKHARPAPPPLPPHNFVNVDLTVPAPAPPAPGASRLSVALLDAASVVHSGDRVTFDALTISKTFGLYMSGIRSDGPPEGTIVFNTERYQASCGWRTIHMIALPAAPYQAGARYQPFAYQPVSLQDTFLEPFSEFTVAVDKICEGRPPGAARGFGSAAEAVAAWQDDFGALPPPPRMVAMPAPPRMVPAPPPIPKSGDGEPAQRQFRSIATDAATGNALYLDAASVVRDGAAATAQSLVLLGPDAQRFAGEGVGVAALRTVRYDCAAHTMTVIAEEVRDRDERVVVTTHTAFAPRGAGEGQVIKSEIDAACGNAPPPDNPAYSSVLAAWHAARDTLGAAADGGVVALFVEPHSAGKPGRLYRAMDRRAERKAVSGSAGRIRPPLLAACAIAPAYADFALDKLRFYANERAALQKLTARKLDEATILAAWRGLGWTERLLRDHAFHSGVENDIQDRLTFQNSFSISLGLSSADADGRIWLAQYVWSLAWIEG